MIVTEKKQIIFILALAVSLGILRSFFLDDPEFTLIKKERVIEEVDSFSVPDEMNGPMMVYLLQGPHIKFYICNERCNETFS